MVAQLLRETKEVEAKLICAACTQGRSLFLTLFIVSRCRRPRVFSQLGKVPPTPTKLESRSARNELIAGTLRAGILWRRTIPGTACQAATLAAALAPPAVERSTQVLEKTSSVHSPTVLQSISPPLGEAATGEVPELAAVSPASAVASLGTGSRT